MKEETGSVFGRAAGLCLLAGALGALFPGGGCSTEAPAPNIVLVVLDTVRSDYAGTEGDEGHWTPSLERLAAEGTRFPNAWSVSPWTLPSHASLFTGLLPSQHECHVKSWRLGDEHRTVAERLSQAGYETAAFFSNPWLGPRATGVLQGFSLKEQTRLAKGMAGGPGDQGGPAINRGISDWLERRGKDAPFFLFVNYLEAHLPYDPPPEYREEHLPDLAPEDTVTPDWAEEFNAGLLPAAGVDWERVKALYGGDVHSADAHLGRLVAMLEERGLYENAVIIVTSDHGESLGENGLVEHQFSVHEILLSVPLVIRAPERLAPGVRDDPVVLTDLFATILDLAGIEEAGIPPHSRSLLGEPAAGAPASAPEATDPGERLLFAEYLGGHRSLLGSLRRLNPGLDMVPFESAYKTVRRGDYRLTVRSDGKISLHHVGRDPRQAHDLSAEHPEIVGELLRPLAETLGEVRLIEGQEVPLDAETEQQLRALGYLR